jgi:hypothetical protein
VEFSILPFIGTGEAIMDDVVRLATARRTLRLIATWAANDHRSGLRREEAMTAIYQQAMKTMKETSHDGNGMDADVIGVRQRTESAND